MARVPNGAVRPWPLSVLIVTVLLPLSCGPATARADTATAREAWVTRASLHQALAAGGDARAELQEVPAERYSERVVIAAVGETVDWTPEPTGEFAGQPARIDFGLWIDAPPQSANDVFVEVTIDMATNNGEPKTIFRRTLRSGDHWRTPALTSVVDRLARHHLSLGALDGAKIALSFRSKQLLPETAAPLKVVWANPLIRTRQPTPAPNVVFICLDTLRHDRVIGGSPTDPQILTQAIGDLAADGVVFTNAVSHSPWTLPSVASVMTGLPPSLHGAGNLMGSIEDPDDVAKMQGTLDKIGEKTEAWRNLGVSRVYMLLSDAVPTLPEYLGASHESYLVNSKNGWLKATHLDHRFDSSHIITGDDARAARLGGLWTDQRTDSLFFIYYHLMYVHEWTQTYQRPDIEPELGRSVYDAGVVVVDQTVGDILDHLREQDLYDSSLIVLWSDHGEHLWDPGWGLQGHGNSLSQQLLRVPLVVKYPDSRHAGMVVSDLVRLRDIFPTVLSAVGVVSERIGPEGTWAVDLGDVIDGSASIDAVFSEFGSFSKGLHGVQRGRYRLVEVEGDEGPRLIDTDEDRYVEEPLNGDEQLQLDELSRILGSYLQFASDHDIDAEALDLDAEDVAALKALGYL